MACEMITKTNLREPVVKGCTALWTSVGNDSRQVADAQSVHEKPANIMRPLTKNIGNSKDG